MYSVLFAEYERKSVVHLGNQNLGRFRCGSSVIARDTVTTKSILIGRCHCYHSHIDRKSVAEHTRHLVEETRNEIDFSVEGSPAGVGSDEVAEMIEMTVTFRTCTFTFAERKHVINIHVMIFFTMFVQCL